MNYLQDKKVKKKKYLNITYFVVGFLILFYFRNGLFNKFSYIAGYVFHPVLYVGNGIGGTFSSLGSYFSSKSTLSTENEKLRQDLADARTKVVSYETIVSENNTLKEALGRKNDNANLVWAPILSKPSQSPYDTLVIDGGSNEGFSIGAMVFAYGDVPVGRISEINHNSSKVILFSNSSEKTQVVVGDKSIFMDIVGRGGGNFEMNLPNDFVIQIGDKVVLPGIKPYAVAVMEKVISDPRDAFQKVLLVSPVNIQELKFVEVEI